MRMFPVTSVVAVMTPQLLVELSLLLFHRQVTVSPKKEE